MGRKIVIHVTMSLLNIIFVVRCQPRRRDRQPWKAFLGECETFFDYLFVLHEAKLSSFDFKVNFSFDFRAPFKKDSQLHSHLTADWHLPSFMVCFIVFAGV